MHPPLSTKPQPEPENKFPDCLYMELTGVPVQPDSPEHLEFLTVSTRKPKIELHLTLHFNEQWATLAQGRIKFGLKGGELRLKLKNSEIPYEARQLVGSIKLQRPQSAKNSLENTGQKGKEVLAPALKSALNSDKTPARLNGTGRPHSSQTQQVCSSICHIAAKVSEENPVWIFEEESGQPILKGVLQQAKLATLNILTLPCHVEATFAASKRDVCLTDAEKLWPPDISRNKKAVLDRLIIQRLLEPKLKPYLSRAELHYG
jgi:hypothetical protein